MERIEEMVLQWFLPHPQNPWFIGRKEFLTRLHHRLHEPCAMALTGLSGIGKTQIANEYAYHYRNQYQAVLWMNASSHDALSTAIQRVDILDAVDQNRIFTGFKDWLSHQQNWLIVLTHIEDFSLIDLLIPPKAPWARSDDHTRPGNGG